MYNTKNIILRKSYSFALEIVQLYKYLHEKKEFVLSKQLLRSGTSIGANVHEAISAQSKKDFVNKLEIAQKEIRETQYWINLLLDSNYIENNQFEKLNELCNELTKIVSSIILTTKQKYLTVKS